MLKTVPLQIYTACSLAVFAAILVPLMTQTMTGKDPDE